MDVSLGKKLMSSGISSRQGYLFSKKEYYQYYNRVYPIRYRRATDSNSSRIGLICKGINLIEGFWLVQNMDYSYHTFHSIPKMSTLF